MLPEPDPHGRIRDAIHRFASTIIGLQWWTEPHPSEDGGPLWMREEWDLAHEYVAASMTDADVASRFRERLDEAMSRAKPVKVQRSSLTTHEARSADERQAVFDECRELVDSAAADRSTDLERRLASQRVADSRSRATFSQVADHTNEASLTIAVAALELLLGEIVRLYVARFPDVLKGGKRSFPVGEIIEALESGRDLREVLVAEAVDAVVGRTPAQLRKWFDDDSQRVLRIDVERNCRRSWDDVAEVFERRHAIIHAGTQVDDRYHAMVTGAPPIGTSLRIAEMYMEDALFDLAAFGVSTALEVWARLYPDEVLRPAVTCQALVDRLQYWGDRHANPWPTLNVVADAMTRGAADAEGPDADTVRTVLRLTQLWVEWNSEPAREGDPRTVIERWEPSVSVVEQFARAALLEDDEVAGRLRSSAIAHPDFAALVLLPEPLRREIAKAAQQ